MILGALLGYINHLIITKCEIKRNLISEFMRDFFQLFISIDLRH